MSIQVASPVASSDAGMDHIRTLIDEEQLMKQLDQDRRMPISPATRAIPAMSRVDSIFHTASIVL